MTTVESFLWVLPNLQSRLILSRSKEVSDHFVVDLKHRESHLELFLFRVIFNAFEQFLTDQWDDPCAYKKK